MLRCRFTEKKSLVRSFNLIRNLKFFLESCYNLITANYYRFTASISKYLCANQDMKNTYIVALANIESF